MGKKKQNEELRIPVNGVSYEVFASVKRPQYLRFYGVILLVLLGLMIYLTLSGGLQLSSLIFLAVVILLMGVLVRSTMKGEWSRSGIGSMVLTYGFSETGWSVEREGKTASVRWEDTYQVKRSSQALLLYPSKKSVNVIPARGVPEQQLEQILKWSDKSHKKS